METTTNRGHAMTYHDTHRCTECAARFEDHATEDNEFAPAGRCPGPLGGDRFPSDMVDETSAQAVFAARLDRYWNARKSTFSPR